MKKAKQISFFFPSNKAEEKAYVKIRNKVKRDGFDGEDVQGREADKRFKELYGVEYMVIDYDKK
jgi:hypothetical protein